MTFILGNLRGQSVPPVTERPVKDGASWEKGALLKLNAGEYEECGADPTVVDAIALTAAGPADPAVTFTTLPTREFPPGFAQGQETQPNVRFTAEYVGDVDAAVVGTKYGVVKGSDGLWRVDFTDTTNDVVKLISKDWVEMLEYTYVHESVEHTVVKGSNRVLVEFVTPQTAT